MAMWLLYQAMYVSVASLRGVYASAVKNAHEMAGYVWTLRNDALIRRVMRYVKKRYGLKTKTAKFPVTVATILAMAKKLPGWPRLEALHDDDLTFLTASMIGTLGFLRGGEFLTSPHQSRAILKAMNVTVEETPQGYAVSVNVVRPKAQWWELEMKVMCFAVPGPLSPVDLLNAMRQRGHSGVGSEPAFVLRSGEPLSKSWMLQRTKHLLASIPIVMHDELGQVVGIRASSWRSGGVESARLAGIGDPVIMAMGRWSSNAWIRYSVASSKDLQGAAQRIWTTAESAGPIGDVVGSADLPDLEEEPRPLDDHQSPQQYQVGDRLNTPYGVATVQEVTPPHPEGNLQCSFEGFEGVYRVRMHDASEPVRRGRRPRNVMVVEPLP
jgi:hypothetical protein